MSDWGAGYALGIAVGIGVGLAIGMAAGKKQKPLSELSKKEKRARKIRILTGAALLVLGVIVFTLLLFR